ncbi:MAG: hypothetical protein QMC67_06400 [Candidatus Wallbacteria bacterium]
MTGFKIKKICGNLINSNSKGIIIPIVLIMSFIFVLFLFVLTNRNTANKRINMMDVERRKAYFLAKGGAQLALLKLSLLPTECYDALAISQLKNPFFSLAIGTVNPNPKDSKYNPGPKFLTLDEGERKSKLNDPQMIGTKEEPMKGTLNEFIVAFMDDIKLRGADVDANDERTTPYRHGFKAKKVKVLAVSEQKLYNKQTVELTIRGWVYDNNGQRKENEYTQIVEVERK